MATEERRALLDIRRADAAYRSFPTFDEWMSGTSVDTVRWERYARLLEQRAELTPERLARAREVAKRAAAVDTGAIEGLYDADRGFTFSVALQLATWEAQLDAKGSRVRSIIEAQMDAYDFVLDFATQSAPIAEAWIRTLHEVMCRGQETYNVYTEIGLQEHPLPLGRYKLLPNHVVKSNGSAHSYAPVDLVPAEMQRLCAELRTQIFTTAHPVLQAAYAHYAFVVVHPFADGNGRVARALASVFTYRALSVPLLILAEHRSEYYFGLEAADSGEYQPFVDFTLSRTLDSIQLVSDTLRAAGVAAPLEAAAHLKRVYQTRGGFTHSEVDAAGYRMFDAFLAEIKRQTEELKTGELSVSYVTHQNSGIKAPTPSYRTPVTDGARHVSIIFQTPAPAAAKVTRQVILEVPTDSGKEDDLIIRCLGSDESLESRLTEAHPVVTGTLQLRIAVFVQGILGRAISELAEIASQLLKTQKY